MEENTDQSYQYCDTQNIGLSDENTNFMVFSEGVFQEIQWQVRYFENDVELSYWGGHCGDDCKLQKVFMFKKTNGCIAFNYAFSRANHLYNGIDVNEINVPIVFQLQEWIENEKFAGQLLIDDVITHNFWITQTPDDSYFIPDFPVFEAFESCLQDQLPVAIDMNHDGISDFEFGFDKFQDIARVPPRSFSYVTTTSLSEPNQLLIDSEFNVVYSTERGSITSQNKNTINAIDIGLFTNFNPPYSQFNNWKSFANAGVFDPEIINYNASNYLLVKMILDNEDYYGWVNFSIDFNNCILTVHQTYLNDVPNEHVVIN
jgi:hypothetical protein